MQKVGNIVSYFQKELNGYAELNEINSWAYITIEFILGYSRAECILNHNQIIKELDIKAINEVISELKLQKPIQYILEESKFYNLKFKLNNYTLIPRPETEELVAWILEHNFSSILDIATGSGCIAISIAVNSSARVSAFDISAKAITVAKKNAKINGVDVNFSIKDVFDVQSLSKYDIIVSNPPYVLNSEKEYIKKNILDYEPHSAIFVSDSKPLIYYEKIAHLAFSSLNSEGKLFLEINELFSNDIISLLDTIGFVDITLKKDINDKPRMIKASKK